MTQEQFIKILPAYMGCQALLPNGMRGTIVCIELSGDIIVAADKAYELHASDIKLILRSFDQMMDEEHKVHADIARDYFKALPTLAKNTYERRAQINARQTNYLRSIGVDCDNLIDAGWAIKEESK